MVTTIKSRIGIRNFTNDKENIKNKNNKNVVIVIGICGEIISVTMKLNIMAKMGITVTSTKTITIAITRISTHIRMRKRIIGVF